MKNNCIENIDSIKLIISALPYRNLSVSNTINSLLKRLLFIFNLNNDKSYLELGYIFICAYIELGFNYYDIKQVADLILSKLIPKEDYEIPAWLDNIRISLNKTTIRHIIGRWPASPNNSHTKSDMINDIIAKVYDNIPGVFTYYNSSDSAKTNASFYKLIVTEENIFFHNISKQKYYIIKKPQIIKEGV